jgi:probable rRNA maturation factor
VSALVRAPAGRAAIARLAAAVLRAERAPVRSLSVTLVGPRRIRTLNRAHLGHDRLTDVIAFAMRPGADDRGPRTAAPDRSPASGPRSPVVGDIYICPAAAAANARTFGTAPREELLRLVVHGILHVTGHDHPAGAARTASPMWRTQERYLARFGGTR